MRDSYIKLAGYHADFLFSKNCDPALKAERVARNSNLMANAENNEHFLKTTYLSHVFHHVQ